MATDIRISITETGDNGSSMTKEMGLVEFLTTLADNIKNSDVTPILTGDSDTVFMLPKPEKNKTFVKTLVKMDDGNGDVTVTCPDGKTIEGKQFDTLKGQYSKQKYISVDGNDYIKELS